MLTFLFWNLNGKNLLPSLVRLVAAHDVDVLILAECTDPQLTPAAVLLGLNPIGEEPLFHYALGQCDRIQIFTRFPSSFAKPFSEDSRYTIRRLILPGCDEILLVAAHLLSQLNATGTTLNTEAIWFAEEIRRTEADLGHSRTLVVGDFNMNPFSDGVVSASGLHGVMTQKIAKKGKRKIQGKDYPFFYNPMWNCLGDRENTPAGTYYYRNSDHVCYFWNTFDQVLIRPALLDTWDGEFLQILASDGTQSFLKSNELPDKTNFSYHLPLLFRLNL